MRFIVMHKVDADMEAGGKPSQDILKNMGELVQSSLKQGVFLNGAGLHRSARRVRVERKSGEYAVTKGPFSGQNEVVSGLVMISARGVDAAVEHAKALSSELDDADVEVGAVVEPWDLGFVDKPNAAPERFLLLTKATAKSESSGHAERHAAAVKKLSTALGEQGAVLASESLMSSQKGSRSAPSPAGKRVWVDGPFAESKELIAGFSLLQLPTKAEALAWADRYAAILVSCEIDVRQVNEP